MNECCEEVKESVLESINKYSLKIKNQVDEAKNFEELENLWQEIDATWFSLGIPSIIRKVIKSYILVRMLILVSDFSELRVFYEHESNEDMPVIEEKVTLDIAERIGNWPINSFDDAILAYEFAGDGYVNKMIAEIQSFNEARRALDYIEEKNLINEDFEEAISAILDKMINFAKGPVELSISISIAYGLQLYDHAERAQRIFWEFSKK